MTESSQTTTTSNGYEIMHPRDILSFDELKEMLPQYGLEGSNPSERAKSLRQMSPEHLAAFMTDINRRVQGSDETLVHDRVMKIGETELIAPEARYDLFNNIIEKIDTAPDKTSPERLGDALALTTTLLHPFKDGNGRTARLIGFMFRSEFDDPKEGREAFDQLAEPRDVARERGGFMIYGYVPYLEDGASQSDPIEVEKFIDQVLTQDGRIYNGPFGQADLQAAKQPEQPQQSVA